MFQDSHFADFHRNGIPAGIKLSEHETLSSPQVLHSDCFPKVLRRKSQIFVSKHEGNTPPCTSRRRFMRLLSAGGDKFDNLQE